MLLKSCGRCGNLIPYGRAYCDKCTLVVEAEREDRLKLSKRQADRRYNKTRDPKYLRFYNSKEWRILSRVCLQEGGYRCRKCGAYASEVDHIKPIQTPEGWELRLDKSNLQPLCVDCHNAKHKRFIKRDKDK